MISTVISPQVRTETGLLCYHCGQQCDDTLVWNEKTFCCQGCKTVFEILYENNLCEYYSLDKNAAISQASQIDVDFTFLDEPSVRKKILTFDSENFFEC
jgi:P-type Cu+ transporter